MSVRRTALLVTSALIAVGCVRAPDPYWVTDPSLVGPYPPAQPQAYAPPPAPPMPASQQPPRAVPVTHEPEHGPPLNVPAASAGAAIPSVADVPPVPGAVPPPREPFHTKIPPIYGSAPAMKYANLSPGACRKALRDRKLPVHVEKKAVRGIANAVRVTGDFNGVRVISAPAPSPFGLLDCRLALALDDTTKILRGHGIAQVYIGSMYRAGARISHRGNKSQHSYGLAMDILSLRHDDGRLLKVERDWHAGIGDVSCGPDAVMNDASPSSILLRNVVCDIARAHIFHHMLTPGANAAHRDHFHFDLKRDANYQSVR